MRDRRDETRHGETPAAMKRLLIGLVALYVGMAAISLVIAGMIRFTQFWLDVMK